MISNNFTLKDGKKLRCGYTTGSCAAAAAKAAACMLLSQKTVSMVRIETPSGTILELEPEDIMFQSDAVQCAVRKDAGDDPDIINGILVYAAVRKTNTGFAIHGGEGVGQVTKPGLACAVGEAAINPVPRRMIAAALQEAAVQNGYTGGLSVIIFIPEGKMLAAKTFNPRLGIVGGLSVLGTSGIVKPMSEQALIDTIHIEMNSRKAAGETHLLAFFGNYGVDFSRDILHIDVSQCITCSNFVGEMLDYAVYCGFEDVLLIGHMGKLVKMAQGIMNTHSRCADGRTTFLSMAAMLAGASRTTGQAIYDSLTTDEAVKILQAAAVLEPVIAQVTDKIEFYMEHRVLNTLRVGAVLFSNTYGVLGYTSQARELLTLHEKKERDI